MPLLPDRGKFIIFLNNRASNNYHDKKLFIKNRSLVFVELFTIYSKIYYNFYIFLLILPSGAINRKCRPYIFIREFKCVSNTSFEVF